MNVILLGGGLDSIAMLSQLHYTNALQDTVALHVNYGQKAMMGEHAACEYFCNKYGVELQDGVMILSEFSNASILGGPVGNTAKANCLELRNAALISYAAVLCASNGGGSIWLGFHKEDNDVFLDAKTQWLVPMQAALNMATNNRVFLKTPFKDMTRTDIFRASMKIDLEIATRSYTCYEAPNARGEECGVCVHCLKKQEMLKEILK